MPLSGRQHRGHTRAWVNRVRPLSVAHSDALATSSRPGQSSELDRPRMIQRNHKKTETPGKPCLVFLGFWSLCLLVTVGVGWWRCVSRFGRGHTRPRGCITCVVPGLCIRPGRITAWILYTISGWSQADPAVAVSLRERSASRAAAFPADDGLPELGDWQALKVMCAARSEGRRITPDGVPAHRYRRGTGERARTVVFCEHAEVHRRRDVRHAPGFFRPSRKNVAITAAHRATPRTRITTWAASVTYFTGAS